MNRLVRAIVLTIAFALAGCGNANNGRMSHPDGTAAMLSGKLEITAHFTSAPFQYQQLENPAIRKVLSSYDATDGPNTFAVIATVARWREANPKLYRAAYEAILEANDFIAKNPREAAEIFVRIENTKLPIDFVAKMISDPEFSYAPEPENVMKIYSFMKAWPAPVIRLFTGEIKQDAVLSAAEDADPAVKQAHTCEANFYGGQHALIEGQRDDAVKLFEAAAKDCPHGFLEGIAATAELKGLGQKVGAN